MNRLLIFSKAWPELPLEDLAEKVISLGFDGVELPVREGYQVNPGNVDTKLTEAVDIFKSRGLEIGSVAGTINEHIIRAMGRSGIKILRVMAKIDTDRGYFNSVDSLRKEIIRHENVLRESQVTIGVQNHCNNYVGSALGLHHLLKGIPKDIAGAYLDFAHCGLVGEPVEIALDILKDQIVMVNFKSAYWFKTNSPDATEAKWQHLWTTHKHSLYNWSKTYTMLREINYKGYITIPAEYGSVGVKGQKMGDTIIKQIEEDITYLKSIMAQ